MRQGLLIACAGVLCITGCYREPARVELPPLSPKDVADAAIKQYDKDGDGALSGAELNQSPPLKAALKKLDAGGGKITTDSLAARIQQWQDAKVAMMSPNAVVKLDGKPLAGATVTIEPESFLGAEYSPVSGTTDAKGGVLLNATPQGTRVGFYRVRVSKQEGGKELLPARYNTSTELGFELAQDSADSPAGRIKLDLKSR